MNITIIGAGNIGGTLGTAWAKAGHTVVFGVRDPGSEKVQQQVAAAGANAVVGANVAASDIAEAIAGANAVLIAIPAAAMPAFLQEHGAALDGKLVFDATNRIGAETMNSVAAIEAAAPNAVIYRAFNNLGWENFAQPTLGGMQVDLIYCGPATAQTMAEQLIGDIGLNPVYIGGNDQLPVVDNLVRLWFALAFGQQKGRRLAFKVIAESGS